VFFKSNKLKGLRGLLRRGGSQREERGAGKRKKLGGESRLRGISWDSQGKQRLNRDSHLKGNEEGILKTK